MKEVTIFPGGAERLYLAQSSSSDKVYEVNTNKPYSCTCVAFAITRNRSVNKRPGIKVTCKHIEAAISQYGAAIEPLSPEAYAVMIAELQQISQETS